MIPLKAGDPGLFRTEASQHLKSLNWSPDFNQTASPIITSISQPNRLPHASETMHAQVIVKDETAHADSRFPFQPQATLA
jgi:hypothetical protein